MIFPLFDFCDETDCTAQPHFTQTTASSSICAPQWEQYLIFKFSLIFVMDSSWLASFYLIFNHDDLPIILRRLVLVNIVFKIAVSVSAKVLAKLFQRFTMTVRIYQNRLISAVHNKSGGRVIWLFDKFPRRVVNGNFVAVCRLWEEGTNFRRL